jgi:hypothetical protein
MEKYLVFECSVDQRDGGNSMRNKYLQFAKYVHPWTCTTKGKGVVEHSLIHLEVNFFYCKYYAYVTVHAFFNQELLTEYNLRFA